MVPGSHPRIRHEGDECRDRNGIDDVDQEALRIPELNFWEETSTLTGERVGRERHIALAGMHEYGAEVGFTETLAWEPADGGAAVFEEVRRIACHRSGSGFVWTWETTLKARRATR